MSVPIAGPGLVTTCRECGAPIRFLKSPKTGRANPIDAEPVAHGNLRIDLALGAYFFIFDAHDGPRYQSHFASCPAAKSFRKRSHS